MKNQIPLSENPRNLAKFLPDSILAPKRDSYGELDELAEVILSEIDHARSIWGLFVRERVLDIFRLVCPENLPDGLSLAAGEKKSSGHLDTITVVCKLASYYVEPDSQEYQFIMTVNKALRSISTREAFPSLIKKPTKKHHPFLYAHYCSQDTPVYTLIVKDLQNTLAGKWMEENTTKRLRRCLTGFSRMAETIDAEKFQEHLANHDDGLIQMFLDSCAYFIPPKDPVDENDQLDPRTRRDYYLAFCEVVGRKEWSDKQRNYGGGGGKRQPEKNILFWMTLDDDLPKSKAPGGIDENLHHDYARLVERELIPGGLLDEELEDDPKKSKSKRTAPSEDQAVMRSYLDPCDWNNMHPSETVWLFQKVLELESKKQISLDLATLVLSVGLTGRKFEFLHSIVIASNNNNFATTYNPTNGLLWFDAKILTRESSEAKLTTNDLFYTAEEKWIIPLPDGLNHRFQEIAKGRTNEPLFRVTEEHFTDLLRDLSAIYQKKFPHAPIFSEGRLRKSCFTMLVKNGLDPVMATMITAHWHNNTLVSLFYTSIKLETLASNYHQSLRNVWDYYQTIDPQLPDFPMNRDQKYPLLYINSPYRPKSHVISTDIEKLHELLNNAQDEKERHNIITITAIIGLGIFLGLRISETSLLHKTQFDLEFTWGEKPIPILVIPNAKSNRFKLSAHIKPLTDHLIPFLLQAFTPDTDDSYAFHIYINNTLTPVNKTILKKFIKDFDLSLMRWHAYRHALQSACLEEGVSFECTNFILSHEYAGLEPLNPYMPDLFPEIFEEYLAFCDRRAINTNWRILENAI